MKRYKKEDNCSYTLGMTLTFQLLEKKRDNVRAVYLRSNINKNDSYYTLIKLCEDIKIEIETNDRVFNILSQKENCYVIGEFVKFRDELDRESSHVLLVNPSNAGNLGTIIRSCLGFGINDIGIIRPAVDVFDPQVVRASMGAIFGIRINYFDTFEEYGEKFKNHMMYPFMLEGSTSLKQVEFVKPLSLIFGNEASGLPEEYSEIGKTVVISHSDKIDSLNLPIAVSIALYQAINVW